VDFNTKKYFADVEDIILSIFNRLPIEEQPKYVVDMGCGGWNTFKAGVRNHPVKVR
jgi:hypothetical protein